MAGLGNLVVSLFADTAQFQAGLTRAQQKAQRAFKQISDIARVATVALVATSVAAAGVAKRAIDLADQMSKASQKFGVSIEFLTGMRYAADLSGVAFDKLSVALSMLAKNASDIQAGTGEAKRSFEALNIEVEDSTGKLKTTEELLLTVADKFSMMEDSTGKTAHAMKIFGESGRELIPLLNNGRKGIEAFIKRAKEMGVVISADMGRASEHLNDTLTELQYITQGVQLQLAEAMLPTLQGFADVMKDSASETGNFKSEFEGLADVLKTLGLGSITIISSLGAAARDLGAGAASVAAVASGEWERASEILKERGKDQVAELEALIQKYQELYGLINKPPRPGAGGQGDAPPQSNESAVKAAAAAIEKLLDSRSKMELDIAKATAAREEAILNARHSANLVGEQEYWEQRMAIRGRALSAELSNLDDQIARQQAALGKAKSGSAEYLNAQAKLETALTSRNELEKAFSHDSRLAYFEASKAASDYSDMVEGLQIRLLELEGQRTEAARRRIALEQVDARQKFLANEDAFGIKLLYGIQRAELAQIEFNEAREDAAAIVTRLGIAEERIQNSRRVGAIDELTALHQTDRARQAAVKRLEEIVKAQERVAKASKNPALVLQAEQARAALERLRSESNLLADRFDTLFSDTFANAFSDFVMGTKSASEAFKDFSNTVLNEIVRMSAKAAATKIFKGLGVGDLFANLLPGRGGVSSSPFSGMVTGAGLMAEGGPVSKNAPYIVGERGPELFVPDMAGTIIPNGAMGGDTYNIDARGADPAQLKRLENMIRTLSGAVPNIAVTAVTNARKRGFA